MNRQDVAGRDLQEYEERDMLESAFGYRRFSGNQGPEEQRRDISWHRTSGVLHAFVSK